MNKTRLTRNRTETKKKTRNQTRTKKCPYHRNQEPDRNQEQNWVAKALIPGFDQEFLVKPRSSWLKARTSWFENNISGKESYLFSNKIALNNIFI